MSSRNRNRGRRTQARRSIPQSQVMAAVSDELKHEACLLASFTDPSKPARGPGGQSQYGTVVATLTAFQTMTLQAPSATHYHYGKNLELGSGPTYSVNKDGDLAIIVNPHAMVYASETTVTASGIRVGMTRDPSASNALDSAILPYATNDGDQTTNQECARTPLQTFAAGFPGGYDVDNTVTTELISALSVPFRTVGLRSTLTVNQPALDAQGEVYAFDNNELFSMGSTRMIDLTHGEPTHHEPPQLALGLEPIHYRRAIPCGSFSNGSTYECCWLPINDKASEFQHYLAYASSPDDLHQAKSADTGNSIGHQLMNTPALIFVLKGLNTSNSSPTLTLATTWSIEVAIDLQGPLGWLARNSKTVPRFLPDWGQLQGVRCAGPLGTIELDFVRTPYFALLYAMARNLMTDPQFTTPAIIGGAKRRMGSTQSFPAAAIAAAVVKYGPAIAELLKSVLSLGNSIRSEVRGSQAVG